MDNMQEFVPEHRKSPCYGMAGVRMPDIQGWQRLGDTDNMSLIQEVLIHEGVVMYKTPEYLATGDLSKLSRVRVPLGFRVDRRLFDEANDRLRG